MSYVDIRHLRYIPCRIRYKHTISYVMYIRHRISISDTRHCIRYVEVNTYDVVCVTYDVVCWHRTSRTMSHVRCRTSTSCISYVRHRMYYVRHNVVRRTYDVVRAWRTTSYVTYDIVGGKNPDVPLWHSKLFWHYYDIFTTTLWPFYDHFMTML